MWFVCLVGFLTFSTTTRLYRRRTPRQSVWQFYVLPHTRQSGETLTSVSAGHIILIPTQPVGSGRPQRESNPGPPHQESRALPTELPRPQFMWCQHLKWWWSKVKGQKEKKRRGGRRWRRRGRRSRSRRRRTRTRRKKEGRGEEEWETNYQSYGENLREHRKKSKKNDAA